MSALKKIGDFTAPKDEATGLELRRQLKTFQGNVSDMGDALQMAAMPVMKPVALAEATSGRLLSPGQSAGFDTTGGDVRIGLTVPSVADAGKWVAIWKPVAANTITVSMPKNVTINGSDALTCASVGLALIFCDGLNYWIE